MTNTSLSRDELNKILDDKVYEQAFSADHPEVLATVERLHLRQNVNKIFSDFNDSILKADDISALYVGATWSNFTAYVPKLLCGLASKAKSNLLRHYLIQTAFEELGGRNHKLIHCGLFDEAGSIIGFDFRSSAKNIHQESLVKLANILNHNLSDSEIIGVTLGLEFPANLNISTLIESIAHTPLLQARLLKTPFFQIHTLIEDEHIRLSVANLLRFCTRPNELDKALVRFDEAIAFWRLFWRESSEIVISFR